MTIWEKSVLLLLLRRRLEEERATDWQTLHQRDRNWYLEQKDVNPWLTLKLWLSQWDASAQSSINLLSFALSALSLILGFSMMAGLLEFLTFERINLLWIVLIAILLPFLWWLAALFFSSAQVPIPLQSIFERFVPQGGFSTVLHPLVKQTVISLGQQLSLLFASSMLLAFLIYLLVTDLAFGWSSTLDLSATFIQQITDTLSWPWRHIWQAAIPSLELIEQSRYFRSVPVPSGQPELLGQWWHFLFMCLLVYVLLPRIITTLINRIRLDRLQQRILYQDALISGLWQRMTTELIDHETEQVEQLESEPSTVEIEQSKTNYPQVICWGIWPDEVITPLREQLFSNAQDVYWEIIDTAEKTDAITATLKEMEDQQVLLLCKGWEPPTGELADICHQLAGIRKRLFLWPAPLPGMSGARKVMLTQSWQAFMRQIPDNFHLITADVP